MKFNVNFSMSVKNMLYLIGSCILVLIGLLFLVIGNNTNKKVEEKKTTEKTTETTTTTAAFTKFKIADRTTNCVDALELLYTVNGFNYSFSCVKSATVFVVFPDGREVNVKTALRTNLVTVDELEQAGLELIKEEAPQQPTTKLATGINTPR